uniref:Uncharacterized protein n=1 Tax=Ciona intestinalis TaxID=7719 RepID=H2XXI3_CIOIN
HYFHQTLVAVDSFLLQSICKLHNQTSSGNKSRHRSLAILIPIELSGEY